MGTSSQVKPPTADTGGVALEGTGSTAGFCVGAVGVGVVPVLFGLQPAKTMLTRTSAITSSSTITFFKAILLFCYLLIGSWVPLTS